MSRAARGWCAFAAAIAGGAATFWAVAVQRLLDSVFETGPDIARVSWLTFENVAVFGMVTLLCYVLFSRLVTALQNRIRKGR